MVKMAKWQILAWARRALFAHLEFPLFPFPLLFFPPSFFPPHHLEMIFAKAAAPEGRMRGLCENHFQMMGERVLFLLFHGTLHVCGTFSLGIWGAAGWQG
jgi:hypothetical protein